MIKQEWSSGDGDNTSIVTIVLCVMWRIKCLPWTLACLESQGEKRLKLAIWNNNPKRRGDLERKIVECRPSFPVHVFHSEYNCGGIGRFLLIKANRVDMRKPVIFIDDDQVLYPGFVAALLQRFGSDRLVGSWAWRFKPGGGYWDRVRCRESEEAHYIGTGGLICDPKIGSLDEFHKGLPERFSRVEDLWLSFYSTRMLGYKLIAAPELVRQVRDGKDQYFSLRHTKTEFLNWLRAKRGWQV